MLPLAINAWGPEEREALLKVVDSGNFTMNEKVKEFETDYANYVGSKYCVACNSGSSANLLMVAAMSIRYGVSSVVVPSVSWSTSYAPFQQYGWKLKFVDIDRETLNYDVKKLRESYAGDDVVLAVNLLGNPNDYAEFASMDVLEDNCESMGAEYKGEKTGTFGLMSSHSTFFSHHIQTMEGGMVTTDDEYFYQMLLCLRSHGWTRHLPKNNLLQAKVSSYEFIYPGYNLRPTEIQGAVGVAQIRKLPKFIEQRRLNAKAFQEKAKERGWKIQKEIGKSSWFGFSILSDEIDELKKEFDAKGIEHRPVVAGNFLRSASIKYYDHDTPEVPNATYVHTNGLYIGNNHQQIDWSSL